ncbi:hypothetical protein [Sphingomonas sp. M1-B02]|uniref:hypothetical protein n=1 Tax=Sphingomonas sp. M1-B02 TaxID=3114300 RepID=UPI00223F425F|nr:hypothetical protein [Sphingomonas sp. S6-11]UZK67777.1 hypothetical protein OKW87_08100 [Sphingomonas sp. S6-11]
MNPSEIYVDLAAWIGDGIGANDAMLHIHAGMAVLLLARVISGRSLASPVPLAFVYLAEIVNEIMDYFGHGQVMDDTFSDFANTVFWPTALFVALQLRSRAPGLFRLGRGKA